MHDQARTISNGDVKIDLRRMGILGLKGSTQWQNNAFLHPEHIVCS